MWILHLKSGEDDLQIRSWG